MRSSTQSAPSARLAQVFDTVFDRDCPQKAPMDIVRCTGHQHFGGQCIELFNLDKNETICRTCPVFGNQTGVPGNEDGYVVRIPDDDLTPPYTVAPGTRVRIMVSPALSVVHANCLAAGGQGTPSMSASMPASRQLLLQ